MSDVRETADTPPIVPALEGLRVTAAELAGSIESGDDGGEVQLHYLLRLDVLTAEALAGVVRVGGLPLPGRSWRELPGAAVTFGEEAIDLLDGRSVRVLGAGRLHLPVVQYHVHATELRLIAGPPSPPSVDVRLALVVERPPAEGGDLPLALEAQARLGPIALRGDTERPPPEHDAALALAARFLDLDAYEVTTNGTLTSLRPA